MLDGSSRWENAVRLTAGAICCAAIRSAAGIPSRTNHLDVEDHQIRFSAEAAARCGPGPLLGLAQSGTLTGGWAAQVVGPGPGSPTAEAMVSKAIQCGFESHPGHNSKAHQNVGDC